jgi:hypothetical protein
MTGLAALVAVCTLALVPAAHAGAAAATPRVAALAGDDGGWVPGFLSWLTERARALGGGLRAIAGAGSGCADPDGAPAPCPIGEAPAVPQGDGDSGICVDPNGAPAPCSS